jgi:hypothetical protein
MLVPRSGLALSDFGVSHVRAIAWYQQCAPADSAMARVPLAPTKRQGAHTLLQVQ